MIYVLEIETIKFSDECNFMPHWSVNRNLQIFLKKKGLIIENSATYIVCGVSFIVCVVLYALFCLSVV
jgi:hypothetical protein